MKHKDKLNWVERGKQHMILQTSMKTESNGSGERQGTMSFDKKPSDEWV